MGLFDDIIDGVTGGDGGGSDGGGGSGISGWGDLSLPTWLRDLRDVDDTLIAFGQSPVGFILGAVLSVFLDGVETAVESLTDGVLFVFFGSDGVPSASGQLGIVDIPVFVAAQLGASTTAIAGAATAAVRQTNTRLVDVATSAGPLAPLLYAALVAAVLVVVAWALRTLIGIVAAAIPGLEGIIG